MQYGSIFHSDAIHTNLSFMCNFHQSYIHVQDTPILYSCAIRTMFIFCIIHSILCQVIETLQPFWFSHGSTPHFSFFSRIIRPSPRFSFLSFPKKSNLIRVVHFVIFSLSFTHQLKSNRAPKSDPQTVKRASRSI